jgi:hypothetical protein
MGGLQNRQDMWEKVCQGRKQTTIPSVPTNQSHVFVSKESKERTKEHFLEKITKKKID